MLKCNLVANSGLVATIISNLLSTSCPGDPCNVGALEGEFLEHNKVGGCCKLD